MFPNQEPGGRGPLSKNLYQVLRGGTGNKNAQKQKLPKDPAKCARTKERQKNKNKQNREQNRASKSMHQEAFERAL